MSRTKYKEADSSHEDVPSIILNCNSILMIKNTCVPSKQLNTVEHHNYKPFREYAMYVTM